MSVYLIVEATQVTDQRSYAEYINAVPRTIELFGGSYIARGATRAVLSGEWRPERLIIVRFDSMEKLQAWWDSPEYRTLKPLREKGAMTNAIVVEGVL